MTASKFLLSFLLTLTFCSANKTKMNSSFTQKDILDNLEAADLEKYHFFIDLEHPYFFTAGSRLTLYADEKRWAIVFEKSGYDNRGLRGEIDLFYFGNCLQNMQAQGDAIGITSNMQVVPLIDNEEMERIQGGNFELVSKNIKQVKVRDTLIDIEHDKSVYIKKDITDTIYDHDNPEKLVDIPSLIRYLEEQHPELFRATDKELRTCLPKDLPMLMHIDSWHHEAYNLYRNYTSPTQYTYKVLGKKPSEYETYKMIANILVSRDTTKWKPTLQPNNNWRNWREGGQM
ncbi:DUF7003 family protein [Parasediminibacterium paludis]|uniref:DUF7003 family protein n=1 Tax=Parasediminibacterium paludis TaxID=908966 RepID=A0ABV8PT48_9BACT